MFDSLLFTAITAVTSVASPTNANTVVTPNVLTQHNNNGRTGEMLAEKTLSPATVSQQTFGKLMELPVDGDVYAQPLYVQNANINGARHNTLIVATEHNTVYAFDADATDPSTAVLWQQNEGPTIPMTNFPGETNFQTEIGMTSTPVIDPNTNTIYALDVIYYIDDTNTPIYKYRLHALDLGTGNDLDGSPVTVSATAEGSGVGSQSDGTIALNPELNLQRASLLLANGQIYLGFAAHGLTNDYHGWLLSYDALTLEQNGVYLTTPNSAKGGIWMGGQGPSADATGNVYVCTGNGYGSDGTHERIESIVEFGAQDTSLTPASWFTPSDWKNLEDNDLDMSTGVLLVPNTSLAVSGNKEGDLYFADANNLGGIQAGDQQLVAKVNLGSDTALFASPVYYAGSAGGRIYVWGQSDSLRAFAVDATGAVNPNSVDFAPSANPVYEPGGMLSISANSTDPSSGIVWATVGLNGSASGEVQQGALYAFSANNLRKQLYSSQATDADAIGLLGKFNPPTIANGKVYVGTFSNRVDVYGLR